MNAQRPLFASLVSLLLLGSAIGAGCGGSDSSIGTGSGGSSAGPGPGNGGGGSGGGDCSEEQCDGTDNDCDGDVDEDCACVDGQTQDCYSGPMGTEGMGVCAAGTETCDLTGTFGECTGEVLPSAEVCNGSDDDCNGQTDEGFGSVTCGLGICQVTVDECVDGEPQPCIPGPPNQVELCDGTDDDCDGDVDEGCICQNGQMQPCYTGSMATQNVGECHDGTQACTGGQWGACVGDQTPVAELCDGLDNDCDGTEDDGNPGGGAMCNTMLPGICAAGLTICQGGQINCQQTVQPQTEICNGLDDDCNPGTADGAQDPQLGVGCDGPDTDFCAEGTKYCAGGALLCNDASGNNVDSCNGLDDDCNPNTLDGSGLACNLPNATSSCVGGQCTVTTCVNGWANCDSNQPNGCELHNDAYSNAAPGQSIGTVPSDYQTGGGCTANGCVLHSSYTGNQARYFTAFADDQSPCGGYDSIKFVLNVPAGINYDITVSSPDQVPGGGGCWCEVNGGAPILGNTCTASNGVGVNDQIVLWCDPPLSSTPDFTVNVDVKFISGSSCNPWTLQVYSRGC
jgi:putative metal-binding protein